jgi:protein-S-isoprenylcysteine O-methyltransferase Ste14
MSYILSHTVLGFCWWDLPALIVLIVVIAAFAVKHHNMKKEEKDLEDQLSELYTDETVGIDSKA